LNCYFDTSIYNQILDDAEKKLFLEKTRKRNLETIPSVINKCEILLNRDEERKRKLLELYEEIRSDYFTAKAPTHLLQDATIAIQQGQCEIEINYPIKEDDELESICKELKKDIGIEIEKAIIGARDYIKRKLDEIKITTPASYFTYLDSKNGIQILVMLFNSLCEPLKIELRLNEEDIINIIQSYSTPWKYYLDSHLFFFYRRAVKLENYSKYKNPGYFDLEQCTYLFWAKIFVLEDGSFYEFLKELNVLRGYNKKIFTYDEFKEYLYLGE